MLFNEVHYRNDNNLLDFNTSNIILREAVRAIILDKNNVLMAHLEKTGEYKFPGGGKEKTETVEEALKREVLEEVGYNVITIKEKIGTVTEFALAKEGGNSILKMVSAYYLAEIDNTPLEQQLEEYEKELLFKPCWVEMEEAYKTNKETIEDKKADKTGGINRETLVLEIIKEKLRA
jgi:8-oxo-dGTP pyrophosphatase MutT (NUDIX family)